MKVKHIVDEDIVNYKKASMVVAFPHCTFKCGDACQNKHLKDAPDIEVYPAAIAKRYITNPFTSAVVFQGLEPLDSLSDVFSLIIALRNVCNDDIVVYTGYNEHDHPVQMLTKFVQDHGFERIILKVGKYLENHQSVYSYELGVELASDNQYAFEIKLS